MKFIIRTGTFLLKNIYALFLKSTILRYIARLYFQSFFIDNQKVVKFNLIC